MDSEHRAMTFNLDLIYPAFRAFFWTITGLTCVASVLGFAGRWLWQFELASHFRTQYFVLLTVSTLILLTFRYKWSAVLIGGVALTNLYLLIPLYLPSGDRVKDRQKLRVMAINVQAENNQRTRLLKLVQDLNPDFLALFEVDKSWLGFAEILTHQFEYSRVDAIEGHFGSALFSRYPMNQTELMRFGSISHYAIVAKIIVNDQPFHIISAHVLAPTQRGYFLMRNEQLNNLARAARSIEGPVMLIGDLNLSPWSPYFHDLIEMAILKDSRKGFGIQATWPVGFPLFRIPIDHCLVSQSIQIHNWKRSEDIGGDHFPIVVDFSFDNTSAQCNDYHC